ncbi:YchJ family protein [Moraxella sp. RCAD0137]|uniref:YchJ family protein n=1 Tax=Moraxella sp. RCAD0137 TaxID=1775913 RepID=UPI000C9FE413|nr:YchJ family protein [Moraxella sp. RCAD0137]PNP98994.1 preprotein translocase subunit SecA [Moraxella sp. RCAD0137]
MSIHLCPCGSALAYDDCCALYHQGLAAPNAEALMRSRYCAYVRKDIDYIIDTTLPIQQPLLAVDAIRAWAAQTNWQRLMILSHNPKIGKRHAQVHFRAYFMATDGEQCHEERSAFVRVDDGEGERWYFLDPTVPCTHTGKMPCLCGSNERFKACCGKFLG